MALSAIYDVTTDYLLKTSEIDDLSVKTEMLEKQQQMMLVREQKRHQIFGCVMYALAVYLIFLAVCFVEHDFFLFETDISGKPIIFAEFFVATAIVIWICVKKLSKK